MHKKNGFIKITDVLLNYRISFSCIAIYWLEVETVLAEVAAEA
jgi:uncharacterized membrane protein